MPEGSQLALYLLGPPRIECDGVPVKVHRRKAMATLTCVAVTPEGWRRASLVDLLWPEHDEARGRANLRRNLYALRKTLDGDWLVADRETIRVQRAADVWVDVLEFRRCLAEGETHGHRPTEVCVACAGPLEEAAALYRGDFLAGFSLKDSYTFDDWQRSQAEALRSELARALERLVGWHSGREEFDAAVTYGRRWIDLDPLNDRLNRRMMRLYAWSGQRAAALTQYETCERLLEEELGVAPEEATTALYRAIVGRRAVPPRGRDPEILSAGRLHADEEKGADEPVFVCREAELAQLDGFLEAALEGHGGVVG